MFEDKRSKKIILVANCVFNQNVKLDQLAVYPGAIKEAAEALVDSGIGILQMPCPEMLHLGLDRQVDRNSCPSPEEEKSRIAQRMTNADGKAFCRGLANSLVDQIEDYRKNGFEIVGLAGINGSPTCGVETTWLNDREQDGQGVWIKTLTEEFNKKSLSIPMGGIKPGEPLKAVATVMELLDGKKPTDIKA